VIGGAVSGNTNTRDTVYRAEFGTNGDVIGWENDASVPITFRRASLAQTEAAMFLFGGRIDNDNRTNDTQVAVPAIEPTNVDNWEMFQ